MGAGWKKAPNGCSHEFLWFLLWHMEPMEGYAVGLGPPWAGFEKDDHPPTVCSAKVSGSQLQTAMSKEVPG